MLPMPKWKAERWSVSVLRRKSRVNISLIFFEGTTTCERTPIYYSCSVLCLYTNIHAIQKYTLSIYSKNIYYNFKFRNKTIHLLVHIFLNLRLLTFYHYCIFWRNMQNLKLNRKKYFCPYMNKSHLIMVFRCAIELSMC